MKNHPNIKKYSRYIIITVVLTLLFPLFKNLECSHNEILGGSLKCVLNVSGNSSPTMYYSTGFNYELLKRFAEDTRCSFDIRLAENKESPLDSLIEDSLQIVVMPYHAPLHDSLHASGKFRVSRPFADSSVWVVPVGKKDFIRIINKWHSHFESSEEYEQLKSRFAPSFEPYARVSKNRGYQYISPYDFLFKQYAAQLNWDWRLLAAVVWQESRFRIECGSHKGARGLMQMMPGTASIYEVSCPLDPEENIAGAVKYIAKLERMFSKSFSGKELVKITLAAYNAGQGRILDCINMAKSLDAPYSTWDDLKEVIPFLRDTDFMASDTVARLGVFKGYETVAYVDNVMAHYEAFCSIAPGPSSQDPHWIRKEKEAAEEAL